MRYIGKRSFNKRGYTKVYAPAHHKADSAGYVYEHVLVVEKALGHAIPPGASIHHINEIKEDNRNCNLILCQDEKYHQLIHQRKVSRDACGHAHWRKCPRCGFYDSTERMWREDKRDRWHHPIPLCNRLINLKLGKIHP